jgi:IS4 transposase
VLADRLMCAWAEMVNLKQRGVDCVCRLTSHRKADFRRGRRLGEGDHVVEWPKPRKPRSIDQAAYDALPESLTVRETRVRVEKAGFRTRALVVATTLLDAEEFSADDLGRLYRARWNAELDLRSLKRTLQMDVLRCKTPDLVRKEIWAHVLAYNLIRTVMAQAAARHSVEPRSVSFKGAVQTLQAFQPVIETRLGGDPSARRQVYEQLLDAVATHQVADRPDRFEPRLRKRRPKHYAFLRQPRHEVKRQMANRFSKN